MALFSNIKSAVVNTGKKIATGVYNTVNNLGKQASALTNALNKSPNAGLAGVPAAFNPVPTPKATSAVTGQPVPASTTSAPAAGAPRSVSGPQGPGAYVPSSSSGGSYTPYSGAPATNIPSSSIGNQYTALERSTSAPAKPTISSRGSGGPSLSDYLGGFGSTTAPMSGFGTQTTTPAVSPTLSTYGGRTGTDSTTYYGGTPLSLEAQAKAMSNQANPNVAPQRQSNRAIISMEEESAPRRKAEADAASAEAERIKQARDAAATAALVQSPDDPEQLEQKRYDQEAKTLENQYQAMLREVERLSKPSEEYLRALEEETLLSEEENSVKTGLSSSLNEVNNQPIPQGFLTGQGARLQNLANTSLDRIAGQKVTLQQRLANEQQRRAAAMDVAKLGLSRAGSRSDNASSRAFDYGQDQKKREQTLADKERERAEKTYSVSAGETIYDAQGKVIAKGAYKPTTPSRTELNEQQLRTGESKLRASMGPDGYVDPAVYQQAYKDWPGTTAEFLSKFPPKNYVNPANTWLPAVLRPKVDSDGA